MGPVVREHDVKRSSQLWQSEDFEASCCICTAHCAVVVGGKLFVWRKFVIKFIVEDVENGLEIAISHLKMSFLEVIVSENAGNATNSYSIYIHDTSIAQVVNVRRNPATIGEFLEIIWGFVIPANENC